MLQQATETSKVESDDDTRREPYFKSPAITSDWLNAVEPPSEVDLHAGYDLREIFDAPGPTAIEDVPETTVEEDASLAQLSAYESFIRTSDAYIWLLSKMKQSKQLTCGTPHSEEIGAQILARLKFLRTGESLRKMSRRSPASTVTMTFELEWDPASVLPEEASGQIPSFEDVLCLTGTVKEAQGTTALQYMTQTWPGSYGPVMTLISQLISLPRGKECHCMTTPAWTKTVSGSLC